MKFLKQIIAIVFLAASIWLGYLIFQNEFNGTTLIYDTQYELQDSSIGTVTKLIRGTVFTGLGIFFLGLLAMFSNVVFFKLLFKDDIKQDALKYLKTKRRQINKLVQKQKAKDEDEDDDVDGVFEDVNEYGDSKDIE